MVRKLESWTSANIVCSASNTGFLLVQLSTRQGTLDYIHSDV